MKGEGQGEGVLWLLAVVLAWVGYGNLEVGTPDFDIQEREEGVLRVVTWNVGGSSGHGGRALQDEHLEDVATVLRELQPDLGFLQEVANERQGERLRKRLGRGYEIRLSRTGTRRLLVFARESRLRDFAIESGGGREALGVVVRAPGRPAVLAVSVHADAYSSRRRNREIGRTVESLLAAENFAYRILAGDLNIDLDLDKRRDLFTDDEYRDVETYNFVAQRLADTAQGTGPTAEPDRRLDYVFATCPPFAVVQAGVMKGKRQGDMDHDPVVVDLRLAGIPRPGGER